MASVDKTQKRLLRGIYNLYLCCFFLLPIYILYYYTLLPIFYQNIYGIFQRDPIKICKIFFESSFLISKESFHNIYGMLLNYYMN